jgi:catecholate siderophore receptor
VAGATVGAACTVSIANVFNPKTGLRHRQRDRCRRATSSQTARAAWSATSSTRCSTTQTDLRIESGAKGGFHNTLVVGGALAWEDYSITTASLPRNAAGQLVLLDQIAMANPVTTYAGPINYTVTAVSRSNTTNKAIYAFDNLELNDMFELNGGVRWESNRATFRPVPLAFYPPGTTKPPANEMLPQQSNEDLFSWRIGAVLKPVSDVSLYAAFANAKTPSSSTVRLGCTSGTGSTFVNFCAVAPETAKSYEVGVKANLHGVELTAAVFRNERTNFRVPTGDPLNPTQQVLDGRSRVDGIALGATGYITPEWLVFANYTYLNGRVKQSVSDACLAAPSVACLNSNPANTPAGAAAGSIVIPDPQAGDRLVQTPEHSGSLFTSYRFPFGLELGYGLTYQGKFALNQRTLLGRQQFYSVGFVTHRLLVSYEIKEGLTAQVNVQNLFDKHYYTGIRNIIGTALTGTINNGVISGGWATPGDRRSAVFSLFYSFGGAS